MSIKHPLPNDVFLENHNDFLLKNMSKNPFIKQCKKCTRDRPIFLQKKLFYMQLLKILTL